MSSLSLPFFSDCSNRTSGTIVFLAPMAGVTDAPFRELVSSFGATAVVSEMVSSEALVRNSKKTYKRLENSSKNVLKIVQIMGANPKSMAESAIINEQLGADIIDINMGCPARKVVSNDCGSALMKDEKLAVEIAKTVVKSVKIPVTVKMRLGWDSDHLNCFNLAKKFEEIGVQMLAIHCRTRNQMYTGKANWSAIERLKEIVKIPYLCNGDIRSVEDAVLALNQSKANGVMIGRGTLGRPWFLKQVMEYLQNRTIQTKTPSLEDQCKIIMRHFQNTLDFYGEYHGLRVFRKHFCWYSFGLNGASAFRESINKAENVELIRQLVLEFYEKSSLIASKETT